MRDGVNYSDTFGNRDGYSEPYTAGYGDGGKGGQEELRDVKEVIEVREVKEV